jgi:hypothetical protein
MRVDGAGEISADRRLFLVPDPGYGRVRAITSADSTFVSFNLQALERACQNE